MVTDLDDILQSYAPKPPPTRWFWVPDWGWIVLPSQRVRHSHQSDPRLPVVTLMLCFLCDDWEAIFVQEEFLNAATYSPDRTDNRVSAPSDYRVSLQAVQAEFEDEALRSILDEDTGDPWRGKQTIRALLYQTAEIRGSRRSLETFRRCEDCAAPALPGEHTCYAHHRK